MYISKDSFSSHWKFVFATFEAIPGAQLTNGNPDNRKTQKFDLQFIVAPNRACTRPKQIHIQELVDARKSGRYPKAAIRTAMFRSRRKNRHLLHFTRYNGHGFCETYRHKTTAAIPVDTPVSSRNIPLWLNTCPTYTKYFYFPRTIVYNRQTCWMLSPWHSLRCPYAVCMSRGCQGVKASNQGISACRQTKWRTAVDNAISKLNRHTRDWLQNASLCYRYNPFELRNDSLFGKPFEFVPRATEIEPRPIWSPACSSSPKSFYFPRTVTYDEQTCWMLFPWYQIVVPTLHARE
ncbi:unnamed protein product [Mytilus coruscus]|uniref:Uncharacterized protein n=1 Tax=Mytilus coruscus TaxID=42192 RepID=A0A6J8C881_MYTCO|nr:unnamed protein product [Mytilus coruscus]